MVWKQVRIASEPRHEFTAYAMEHFRLGSGKVVRIGRMTDLEGMRRMGSLPNSRCDCDQFFEIHPEDVHLLYGMPQVREVWVCRACFEMD